MYIVIKYDDIKHIEINEILVAITIAMKFFKIKIKFNLQITFNR